MRFIPKLKIKNKNLERKGCDFENILKKVHIIDANNYTQIIKQTSLELAPWKKQIQYRWWKNKCDKHLDKNSNRKIYILVRSKQIKLLWHRISTTLKMRNSKL